MSNNHQDQQDSPHPNQPDLNNLQSDVRQDLSVLTDNEDQVFLRHLWGSDITTIDAVESKALHSGCTQQRIEALKQLGLEAQVLDEQLLTILKRQGLAKGKEWLEQQLYRNHHPRIDRSLKVTLKKWKKQRVEYQQKSQRQKELEGSYQLPSPEFSGHHPNSLLNLEPHHHWKIHIDETGKIFDEDSYLLDLDNYTLGRVVALAEPVGRVDDLPPLTKGFHSSKQASIEIDQAIGNLLQRPVGILGFTLRDKILDGVHNSWMVAIHTLMRWVLRSLPLTAKATVEFLIEQRDGYSSKIDLLPQLDLMAAGYNTLHGGDRRVKLSARFVGKDDDPLNGYIDAICYTWGSSKWESRQRLATSRLQGHCLINGESQPMLRLLQALSNARSIEAPVWYQLMNWLDELPDHSIAHLALKELGKEISQQGKAWQGYLNFARQQLLGKQYQPRQLQQALGWLKETQPEGLELPPLLELEWLSLQQANANHSGHLATRRLLRFKELTEQLQEEDSPRCSAATLRIAMATTNSFAFDAASRLLEPWLAVPVAQVGTLNYGKMRSASAQIAALQGDLPAAIAQFDAALQVLGRLSSAGQRQRELQQTGSYRLLAALDQRSASEEDIFAYFAQKGQELNRDYVRELALTSRLSGQRQQIFDHFLLLRVMALSDHLGSLHSAYLDCRKDWGHGGEHPWPLISFYRGCLLIKSGDMEAGKEYQKEAIGQASYSENNGPIVQWQGLVFAAYLGFVDALQETKPYLDLKEKLPLCPWDRLQPPLAEESLADYLQARLPFNFH